jgi:cytoskeletal protein RodZ
MKTVGQLLRRARIEAKLEPEDVAKATKIKVDQLKALENDEFHRLPPATYVQGFIKNIAAVLDLDEEEILALFRRDYQIKEKVGAESMELVGKRHFFSLTPQTLSILIGLAALLLISAYVGFNLLSTPPLEVNSPQDGEVVRSDKITVSGRTIPNVSLSINGQEVNLKPDGRFLIDFALKPGVNQVSIVVKPSFGRENRVTRTVFFQVDDANGDRYAGDRE